MTLHGTVKFSSVHPDPNKSKLVNSHSVKFSNPNRVSFLDTKPVHGHTIQGLPFSNVNTLDNLNSVQGNNDSQEIAMPRFQIQIQKEVNIDQISNMDKITNEDISMGEELQRQIEELTQENEPIDPDNALAGNMARKMPTLDLTDEN